MEQGIASPARQRWQIVLAQALSSPREQSINTGSWGSLSSIYALGRITCAAAGDAGAAEAAHTGRTWLRAGERTRLGSARSDGTSARDERSDRRGIAHAHHSSPTTASVALDLRDLHGYLHFLRYTPNVVTPGDGPVST